MKEILKQIYKLSTKKLPLFLDVWIKCESFLFEIRICKGDFVNTLLNIRLQRVKRETHREFVIKLNKTYKGANAILVGNLESAYQEFKNVYVRVYSIVVVLNFFFQWFLVQGEGEYFYFTFVLGELYGYCFVVWTRTVAS